MPLRTPRNYYGFNQMLRLVIVSFSDLCYERSITIISKCKSNFGARWTKYFVFQLFGENTLEAFFDYRYNDMEDHWNKKIERMNKN